MALYISMVTKKELLDAEKEGKLLIGSNTVIKGLKGGKMKIVLHSDNCPDDRLNNIKKLSTISNIKVEAFKGNSRVLGEALGKPYNISVVGIKK